VTEFLAEIVGHGEAREALHRMLVRDRVPSGLLLHGDEGRGKRTIALAFARVLLAGSGPDRAEPGAAGVKGLAADDHPDLEIVAREEDQRLISIDKIRALREAFSLTPASAPRRVAVVVDAERLTPEAGNALLKLLEEPPPHSHLILTARAKDAVMETLVSRCRHIRIPPLGRREVIQFLERHDVEPDRARLAALLAEGRPGFALRLAEGDFEDRVLGPAFTLLHPVDGPCAAAESVGALAREGSKKVEGARERVRIILYAVSWFLRAALRAAEGSAEAAGVLDLLESPLGDALRSAPGAVLEARLEAVLAARADVDRNVGIELVLENLAAALSGLHRV